VAVDIPSGLSSETGWPLGVAVEAHHTVTFALAKVGLFTYPGCEHAGQVHVIDIGIPRRLAVERGVRCHLLEEARVRALLPRRRLGGHKGSYGHLLILAGSPGKTGAAALCAAAAVRGGAGLVTVATADDALRVVQGRVPEAMCERFLAPGSESATDVEIALARLRMLLEGKRALAVGPGIETSAGMAALLRRLVAELELPCVIDADGLNLLAAAPEALAGARAPLALTPHPGEMARLAGLPLAAVQADRMAITRALAARLRAWVALKGARTVIATPDGTAFINPTGNPGMGSGGTGDVLTGMVGALLAQGLTPFDALQVATYAHGRAGDEARDRSGEMGLSAGDLLRSLPRVLRRLETPSSSLAVDDAGPRLAPVVETPSSPSTYQ
jgi:NAD(P)H-hydrate epimerase